MKEIKKFLKSFVYAWSGIFHAIDNERNMRIHIVVMAYMYSYLLFFDFFEVSKVGFALIFLANALVLAMELINTAIERTVDMSSKEITLLSKQAKDVAAGAVLVSAIFSVFIAVAVLWQPTAFAKIFEYYKDRIIMFIVLILSLVVSGAFVFAWPKIRRKPSEEK